jgi:TonB-linked SusC/RagA family outer membrane protein
MRKFLLFGFLFFMVSTVFAQERRVTGKVTAESDGGSLPGVSVNAIGTSVYAQTNDQGEFSINLPSGATALRFTSVGFISKDITVGNQSTVNVVLAEDENMLEEIVVQVPYGTVRQSAFVGSQTTVGKKQIESQRVSSFTRTLDGLVPGLVSTSGGGQPGTNASIQIRGVGSVNASSGPLYVLDGVVYSGSNVSLSTDDIESVTVLKDASATALYGSRAANGVIMVTTKKGKAGKPQITFNARTGFQERGIPEYDRVNQQQYYELMWEATRNRLTGGNFANITPAINQQASNSLITGLVYNSTNVAANQVVGPDGKFNPNASILWDDNWSKELFRKAFRQDYNMNISGGSQNSDYFVSLGYLDEPGMTKFSNYNRYTGRVAVNSSPTKWMKTGVNMDGTISFADQLNFTGTETTNPFYYSRNMGPIYPVWQRDASGNFVKDPITGQNALDWGVPNQMGARPYAGLSNLLGSLDLDDRLNNVGQLNTSAYVEVKFLKDFTFKTTVGGTIWNGHTTSFQNSLYGDAQNVQGRSTKANAKQLNFTFNKILTYDKTFGDHSFNVLAGHENYSYTYEYVSGTKVGFPFPGTNEIGTAATITGANSYTNQHRIESYLSNLRYTFKNKYLFNASFRTDGSSRFFPGNDALSRSNWGNFWSIGAGYNISQEPFMKSIAWLDDLKIKGSFGQLGNESLNTYYAWQSLYALGWNNAGNPGAVISSLANESLTWENNQSANLGIDFSIFKNKLSGSIEWFKRTSKDMLFPVPLAPSTGISEITKNVGDMYNAGIEMQLGYNVLSKRDFDWRLNVNFTHYKNKVTRLAEESAENGVLSGSHKIMVGKPMYSFFIREYAGVDPETGDALFYKDILGADGKPTGERTTDNRFSQGTQYFHGSAIPDFRIGFNNMIRYKGFDLSFLVNWQQGGQYYDGNYATLMHVGSYGSHWHADILNRWQKPGDITEIPRVQNALADQSGVSTRFLYDASFVNIRNATLGYDLPKSVIGSLGVQKVGVYVSGDNLHLFHKRKGADPQYSFGGGSGFGYPVARTYTFGVTVGF